MESFWFSKWQQCPVKRDGSPDAPPKHLSPANYWDGEMKKRPKLPPNCIDAATSISLGWKSHNCATNIHHLLLAPPCSSQLLRHLRCQTKHPQTFPPPSPIPFHPSPKSHIRKVSVQLATQLTKTADLDHPLCLTTVFITRSLKLWQLHEHITSFLKQHLFMNLMDCKSTN